MLSAEVENQRQGEIKDFEYKSYSKKTKTLDFYYWDQKFTHYIVYLGYIFLLKFWLVTHR